MNKRVIVEYNSNRLSVENGFEEEEEEKRYSFKSHQDKIDNVYRYSAKARCRNPISRGGYSEIRPRVVKEFEEEEAKRLANRTIVDRIVEVNPFLKNVYFWPWSDGKGKSTTPLPSPTPEPPTPPPPEPPSKSCRERFAELWKKIKGIIPKEKAVKVWTRSKEVIHDYWEMGTHGWYLDLTPREWPAPEANVWPVGPYDVYWFPDVYFSNKPCHYSGPFAIGYWPVRDPVPHFPGGDKINAYIERKWAELLCRIRARRKHRKEEREKCAQEVRDRIDSGRKKSDGGGGGEGKGGEGKGGEKKGGVEEKKTEEERPVKPKKKRKYHCDHTDDK